MFFLAKRLPTITICCCCISNHILTTLGFHRIIMLKFKHSITTMISSKLIFFQCHICGILLFRLQALYVQSLEFAKKERSSDRIYPSRGGSRISKRGGLVRKSRKGRSPVPPRGWVWEGEHPLPPCRRRKNLAFYTMLTIWPLNFHIIYWNTKNSFNQQKDCSVLVFSVADGQTHRLLPQ